MSDATMYNKPNGMLALIVDVAQPVRFAEPIVQIKTGPYSLRRGVAIGA